MPPGPPKGGYQSQQERGARPSSGGPHGSGGRPRDSEEEDLTALLTPSKSIEYFEGPAGTGGRRPVRAALLDSEAQDVAKKIRTLPASQLRRFYASVLSLKRELEIDKSLSDSHVLARLALLKAHVAYAKKRMNNMPGEFVKFIVDHVAAVKTREDFLSGFAPCFEAVVAYHKLFETKQRGN